MYPPVCGICGKINKEYICDKCINEDLIIKYDNTIKTTNSYFNRNFYLFEYNGIIREKMIEYKFNEKSYLYKTFEKILIKSKNICEFINWYDIIIPVPIHKKRNMERGYNQSALIIKELIKELKKTHKIDITYDENIIFKIKNTNKQSTLGKNERKINIKDAYIINEKKHNLIENSKILIFDDIFTTGNTVNECAKMLRKYHPKEIDVLTYAKD